MANKMLVMRIKGRNGSCKSKPFLRPNCKIATFSDSFESKKAQ
jgi:hypothetical protein